MKTGDQDATDDWVARNRAQAKWTRKELVLRVLWAAVSPAFRMSPRIFWGWRRLLLRSFWAKVGAEAQIYPSVLINIP